MASSIQLYSHQLAALSLIRPGCILKGGVGSGKTLTSLSFYKDNYSDKDLYVITTAKKRNTGDWKQEAELIGVKNIVVDSWNNIHNYTHLYNVFFIFDEQRVVGSGAWAKNFIAIAKKNTWILLTATPGDTWSDYIPVFLAHGFYKNKTEFIREHVEYDRFAKYPKIKSYHNQEKLFSLRDSITIDMTFERKTTRHKKIWKAGYDRKAYIALQRSRWNPYTDAPVETPSEFTQCLRRLVSEDPDRIAKLRFFLRTTDSAIIFYNYNYELDIITNICEEVGVNYSEYNGRKHEDVPTKEPWFYIVNYIAGSESWNCITTNNILFYSPNYSYKITEQSEGRIDRLNTPYKHLEYTFLVSDAPIDKAVMKALADKKNFNEKKWGEKRERVRIPKLSHTEASETISPVYRSEKRPELQARHTGSTYTRRSKLGNARS